jgi:hypothetical protein
LLTAELIGLLREKDALGSGDDPLGDLHAQLIWQGDVCILAQLSFYISYQTTRTKGNKDDKRGGGGRREPAFVKQRHHAGEKTILHYHYH